MLLVAHAQHNRKACSGITIKWMQQFHLKVTYRYYNLTSTNSLLKWKSIMCSVPGLMECHYADCHCQRAPYQCHYWASCTLRNVKVCMSLTREFLRSISSLSLIFKMHTLLFSGAFLKGHWNGKNAWRKIADTQNCGKPSSKSTWGMGFYHEVLQLRESDCLEQISC